MTGYCACGRPVENRDTGLCATCSKAGRTPVKVKKAPRPIHKVSKKMADQLKEYTMAKAEHLKEHPDCQARLKEICRNDRRSNTIHHTAKRGKNLTNKATFLTVCVPCHDHIETVLSAKERRDLGYLR